MVIIYKVSIKEDKVLAFQRLANETLISEAMKLSGCKLFSLYQNVDKKNEFIFHEVWDTEESVHRYKLNLISKLGDPRPDEEFPALMNDMIKADEDLV